MSLTLYLNRPVFTAFVNWASAPLKTFTYDLRELQIAFAAPRYERLQNHTVQGYECEVAFRTEADLVAWEEFSAALKGRLGGFWLPVGLAACKVASVEPATEQFAVAGQALRDWRSDHPGCSHLCFRSPSGIEQYGQVQSVAAVADGRELVTLTGELEHAIDQTWAVSPLLYVRLASDTEELEAVTGEFSTLRLRAVELPEEYATVEIGTQPVYLYEFRATLLNQTQVWRFTGLNQGITSLGEVFGSFPIEHRGLRQSMRSEGDDVTIETVHDAASPLSLFVPFRVPAPLWVTIYETTFGDPDSRAVRFVGKVGAPRVEGIKLVSQCAAVIDALGRRFPRFLLQPRCNYALFSRECGVGNGRFTAICAIDALQWDDGVLQYGGRHLRLNVSSPPTGDPLSAEMNYFADGWLETGSGATTEVRLIRQHNAPVDGKMTVRLDRPLEFAEPGQQVLLRAGCDKSAATCAVKFRNFKRWGGHVLVPHNSALQPLETETLSGGKK